MNLGSHFSNRGYKRNVLDLFNQPPYEITMPDRNRHGQNESYQENKEHFKSQTEIVLSHLEAGEEVTGQRMYELHKIQDFRPRIAAIRRSLIGRTDVKMEFRMIPGGKGAKAWRLKKVA